VSIVSGDLVAQAAELRRQDGKDLVTYGHGVLGRSLLKHQLLDQLKLWIHPVLVGRGQLLFREGEQAHLKLVATKTLGTGVVVATYQPA
jgi:dihydrofolate reductase